MTNEKVALATSNTMPISQEEMNADLDAGGKVTGQDIAIPYLYILQSNSPQCNPDNPKYIKGATASMLYLTVMEEVYEGKEKGLIIVPCYFEKLVNEWVPREKGGGLVGNHNAESEIVIKAKRDEKGKLFLTNGNQLVETAYHYILVKRDNGYTQAIFPMKSTALKTSRRWNSVIATARSKPEKDKPSQPVPRWWYEYKLTTVRESKDTNIWSGPRITETEVETNRPDGYRMARDYAKIAATGLLRRPIEESAQDASMASDEDSPV